MPNSETTPCAASGQYIYGLRERFNCDIRYIGKTDNLRRRLRAHMNDRSRCHRTNWIQSVLRRGGKVELVILMDVPAWADWKKAESAWIDHGLRSGWPLTNGTYGGDGLNATPEVRQKISLAMKGRKLTPEQASIASRTLIKMTKGRVLPQEWREAISRGRTGIKFSDAHRRRISQSKRKVSDSQVKEIRQRIAEGQTQSAISKAMGVTQPTISAIKNGLRKFTEEQ